MNTYPTLKVPAQRGNDDRLAVVGQLVGTLDQVIELKLS